MNADRIPQELKTRKQWVVWKNETRGGKPTKVPYQTSGKPAKSDDPQTWTTFDKALEAAPTWNGIGYVFAEDDAYCGIDLDGCRNPETGALADWAREIVLEFGTYAEVSPSQNGVKLFLKGKSPLETGKKRELDVERVADKAPAIEIYDKLRYFAVTGQRLRGMSDECLPLQDKLNVLCRKYFPPDKPPKHHVAYSSPADVLERAAKYLEQVPPAVAGSSGHNTTFYAACRLVKGFGLSKEEALGLLHQWNQTCQPPWSHRELVHKVNQAEKADGPVGYLRDAEMPAGELPKHHAPSPPQEPEKREPPSPRVVVTTLEEEAAKYLSTLHEERDPLIELGIADVDYAIGGGVALSEMVVVAARPSHGKTAVAMQCVHHASRNGHKSLFISEEMSKALLAKRTIQYIADVPEEHWKVRSDDVRSQAADHFAMREPVYIAESCRDVDQVAKVVERAAKNDGVSVVVVDYTQKLRAPGGNRYEQVTNASAVLKQLSIEHNVVMLALCQLSREIEKRNAFLPKISDLRESGQIEQDADVVLFLVWPWMIDRTKAKEDYTVYVAKNRNRATNSTVVDCRFWPMRQMVLPEQVNREPAFDAYNAAEF